MPVPPPPAPPGIRVERGALDGLLLITPPRLFRDARGFFVETYRENEWSAIGLPKFVQDNQSRSSRGVLRGLHFNLSGGGQGKLVRVLSGRIWDVAVDVRRSSPTLGKWQAFELDDVAHQQLYIPPGFAHGFLVLSEMADVTYKLTTYYDEKLEHGVLWSDPGLAVAWPLPQPQVSKRDENNPRLEEILDRLPG